MGIDFISHNENTSIWRAVWNFPIVCRHYSTLLFGTPCGLLYMWVATSLLHFHAYLVIAAHFHFHSTQRVWLLIMEDGTDNYTLFCCLTPKRLFIMRSMQTCLHIPGEYFWPLYYQKTQRVTILGTSKDFQLVEKLCI